MLDRLRDDGWMVDGSGGWKVDSRSPENEEVQENLGEEWKKGDLQGQWG